MSGFTKLFASITESSVWVADDKTLRVWVAMLARCDARGIVEGSVPGFASLCRMSIEDFEERISTLSAPDRYSRTPDNEGRRIEPVEGGWRVLNYGKYREKGQSKAGSTAEKVRLWRAKKKAENAGLHVTDGNPKKLHVRQEAEADNTLQLTAASEGKRTRKRDPLFDALVEIEGANPAQLTPSANGAIGKALSEIKTACPGVTPDEIRNRASAYRRLMPRATITANALAKYWARCGGSSKSTEEAMLS
ncbi:MAG: hypothetical protein J0M24_10795 [Verrucomicrobia bacterium]|nr:hypothetical protein [Verrucomicrobiota bacterium]